MKAAIVSKTNETPAGIDLRFSAAIDLMTSMASSSLPFTRKHRRDPQRNSRTKRQYKAEGVEVTM